MNWYKIAQQDTIEIKDYRTDVPGIERDRDDVGGYLGIGHTPLYLYEEEPEEPNYAWVYIDGDIDIEKLDGESSFWEQGHGDVERWDGFKWSRLFKGRYDPSTGKISIVPPTGIARYRPVPDFIIRELKRKFPKSQSIHVFSKSYKNIKF